MSISSWQVQAKSSRQRCHVRFSTLKTELLAALIVSRFAGLLLRSAVNHGSGAVRGDAHYFFIMNRISLDSKKWLLLAKNFECSICKVEQPRRRYTTVTLLIRSLSNLACQSMNVHRLWLDRAMKNANDSCSFWVITGYERIRYKIVFGWLL